MEGENRLSTLDCPKIINGLNEIISYQTAVNYSHASNRLLIARGGRRVEVFNFGDREIEEEELDEEKVRLGQ